MIIIIQPNKPQKEQWSNVIWLYIRVFLSYNQMTVVNSKRRK